MTSETSCRLPGCCVARCRKKRNRGSKNVEKPSLQTFQKEAPGDEKWKPQIELVLESCRKKKERRSKHVEKPSPQTFPNDAPGDQKWQPKWFKKGLQNGAKNGSKMGYFGDESKKFGVHHTEVNV